MSILAIDIGGTHIKFRTEEQKEPVRVKSGRKMTPEKMMDLIAKHTADWKYDRVSLGYPGPVVHDKPLLEPYNLARGWVKFDFKKAFGGKRLRIINDAAMQALGSYKGGRMLFLGLGTGLGSAMVVDGVVQAMEVAHMPWRKGRSFEEVVGAVGLEHDGRKAWRKNVLKVMDRLSEVMESEYITLGGGNSSVLKKLPKNVVLGSNENAFKGGFMLWKEEHKNSR